MIEQRIINGSFTELYIGGGDSWLTQSFPTNFHSFHKRKVLAPTESPDDWREVTDKEKAALEASDAAWVRPPQVFIDIWNEACRYYGTNSWLLEVIGKYNEETGYFELNGITDIGYQEAVMIYTVSFTWSKQHAPSFCGFNNNAPIRTNFPPQNWSNRRIETEWFFYNSPYLEVARVSARDSVFHILTRYATFANCPKLRKVIGVIDVNYKGKMDLLYDNPLLEEFQVRGLANDWFLRNTPLISLDSFKYVIENAANTSPITITVHTDVFAKLTDESVHPEWAELNRHAAERQISFASA